MTLSKMIFMFFCGLGLSALSFSAPLTSQVSVSDTLTLNLGASMFPFNTITYATMTQSDTPLPLSSVQAYTTNSVPITMLMTSNTSSDASNNPQMMNGTYSIPYGVTFRPCYLPASQPVPSTQTLKVGTAITISKPYSQSFSCFNSGKVLGVMTFTRFPLAVMPPAGTYSNLLTFTIAEA